MRAQLWCDFDEEKDLAEQLTILHRSINSAAHFPVLIEF